MRRPIDAYIDARSSESFDIGTSVECFVIVRDDSNGHFPRMGVQNCRRNPIVSYRENANIDGPA